MWALDELIEPGIAHDGDDAGLLKHAQDVFELILTKDDLEPEIPNNYETDGLNTNICDFEDLLPRLQKTITQQHTSRINAGKESLKSINHKLKADLTDDDIVITDADLNEMLDASNYTAPYIINIPEVLSKIRADQEKAGLNLNRNRQQQSQNDTSTDAQSTEEVAFEIDDDEEPDIRTPKRAKSNDKYLRQGISLATPFAASTSNQSKSQNIGPPKKSRRKKEDKEKKKTRKEVRRFVEAEPTLVISNVKSLAPTEPPKRFLLPNNPSVRFNNPAAATNGKKLEEANSRLVTTMAEKSPDKRGNSVCKIVSTSGILPVSQQMSSVDQNSGESSSVARINPEMVQIKSATPTGFVLRGVHPATKENSEQFTSYAAQKAKAASDIKLRMSLAQAHIAEKAQNVALKTVAGVEYLGCGTCGKTFPSGCDVMYRNHMMVKHSIEVDDANIESSKIKTDAWYKCRKCHGMILNNKEDHHMACLPNVPFDDAFDKIEVAPNTVRPLACGICNKSYDSSISLRQHLTGFHRDFGDKVLVDPHFRCGKCLRMFEDSIPLTIHCSSCRATKPSDETTLELANGLLFCEICNKKHQSIEKTQECYLKKGLIRCMLCLHTVISRSNFSHHMKVYHNGITCQFCNNSELLRLRLLFEHIVEVHYAPALKDAARVIVQPPQPTRQLKLGPPQTQEKQSRRTAQQPRSKAVNILPSGTAIPPGIIINTNRVSTDSSSGAIINTSRIQVGPPVPPSRNMITSTPGNINLATVTTDSNGGGYKCFHGPRGGLQGFHVNRPVGGQFSLPPGMKIIRATGPMISGKRMQIMKPVSLVSQSTSMPIVRTMTATRPTFVTGARPLMVASVSGASPAGATSIPGLCGLRAVFLQPSLSVGQSAPVATPISHRPVLITPTIPTTVAVGSNAQPVSVNSPLSSDTGTIVAGGNTEVDDKSTADNTEEDISDSNSILGF